MQRSLPQVVGIEEQKMQLMGLVDYIRARQELFENGCPMLLLYQFVADRKLPCAWLYRSLRYLKSRHRIYEPYKGHYKIL